MSVLNVAISKLETIFDSKLGPNFDRVGSGHQITVEQLYLNVLRRPGEQGGVVFWTGHLFNGISRAKMLANFADSPENIAKTAETFADMSLVKEQWIFGHSNTTPEVTSSALNDTGITFGGNYPSGNNAGCMGGT